MPAACRLLLAPLAAAALALALSLAVPLGGGRAATAPERDVSVYAGLGTWLDIYDTREWTNPEAAVDAMAARGVQTLFLETGNYRQRADLVRPKALGRFVEAAHAAGLSVVAWYLPSFANPARDRRRALAAIRFHTPAGERFDSFALDIEASVVKRVSVRNPLLLDLSSGLRDAVDPSYPLGAIVPSAVGMQLHPTYWPGFPYQPLAGLYDVFLPMAYSTYRSRGSAATFDYVARSIAAVQDGVGDPTVPVHAIGGLTGRIGAAEAAGFMRAVAACAAIGYSLYEFPTTSARAWPVLAAPPLDDPGVCA